MPKASIESTTEKIISIQALCSSSDEDCEAVNYQLNKQKSSVSSKKVIAGHTKASCEYPDQSVLVSSDEELNEKTCMKFFEIKEKFPEKLAIAAHHKKITQMECGDTSSLTSTKTQNYLVQQNFSFAHQPKYETSGATSLLDLKSISYYDNVEPNENLIDSGQEHFTTLEVLKTESPQISPEKKKNPSMAHRVLLVDFFADGNQIPAQMEPLRFYKSESSIIWDDELNARKFPRFPICCQITMCDFSTVPSDFCNHITVDHPYVDVYRTAPGNIINFSINTKCMINMINCQRLFLLTDKMKDIGYGAFENCLPITLMTSKIDIRKVFNCPFNNESTIAENLYIWLTGVYQFPVNYTLTVWRHGCDQFEPHTLKSISDCVLFMNKPINSRAVASQALCLSNLDIQRLTNNGMKMLSCQILFH